MLTVVRVHVYGSREIILSRGFRPNPVWSWIYFRTLTNKMTVYKDSNKATTLSKNNPSVLSRCLVSTNRSRACASINSLDTEM